jgi:uncharacterized small protein (DUF1192 family)
MFDEDLPIKKKTYDFPRNLENMSVTDLNDYIAALKAEIVRVQSDINAKKAAADAASSVFN